MKVRNGFVSNSSSSSFLLALGKIENEEMVNKLIEDFNFFGCDIDIKEYNSSKSFFGSEIYFNPDTSNFNENDKIFTIEYFGDEGDSFFYNEETDELEYDFEYEDVGVKLYDFIENIKPYLSNFQITVGAKRIG